MNLDIWLRSFPSKIWRVQPGSLLLLVVNVRGKEWIEEGTVSKKELALDDLGGSRPVQIPKDATGREFSLRKHALMKDQGQGWIAFAEEMRCVTQGSNQTSQQKLRGVKQLDSRASV